MAMRRHPSTYIVAGLVTAAWGLWMVTHQEWLAAACALFILAYVGYYYRVDLGRKHA